MRMSKDMKKKYEESIANTPGPVSLDDIPKVIIDYKGLLSYAKEKGCKPDELSFDELKTFAEELVPGELEKVKEIFEKATRIRK